MLSAVKMAPNHPEILLHSAVVLAANGKRTEASQLLLRAEKASPALARATTRAGGGSVWTNLPALPIASRRPVHLLAYTVRVAHSLASKRNTVKSPFQCGTRFESQRRGSSPATSLRTYVLVV